MQVVVVESLSRTRSTRQIVLVVNCRTSTVSVERGVKLCSRWVPCTVLAFCILSSSSFDSSSMLYSISEAEMHPFDVAHSKFKELMGS